MTSRVRVHFLSGGVRYYDTEALARDAIRERAGAETLTASATELERGGSITWWAGDDPVPFCSMSFKISG